MSVLSIDNILNIPGNARVYAALRDHLTNKRLTAFVGAGASVPLYPLWKELIEALAEQAARLGVAREADRAYWVRNSATKPLQVAAQIRAKLGDARWHPFLYETFKDKLGPDGQMYTPAQSALVRLPLKAIFTTNYDPGLLEARRQVRPAVRETGFVVWNQSFMIQKWSSGDLFSEGPGLPILYAHGHFADPENIVLDYGSYQCAYHNTPYRRLIENIWFQEHLLFVGFGFNDATLNQVADAVLAQTTRQASSPPRHIALLGLSNEQEYSEQLRLEYLAQFNTEILFYPVTLDPAGKTDHQGLRLILDSAADATPGGVHSLPAARKVKAQRKGSNRAHYCFIHETTEDEKFTGRDSELARLDSWAKDPAVRIIAISAIGGLGKTSLTGQWLRSGMAARALGAGGAFFWSFYRDRDSKKMLQALVKFGGESLAWKPPKKSAIVQQALDLLSSKRIAVVLDGLEIVQESPGTVAFGKVLQVELAEFLHAHCNAERRSLIVLTSRFPFPDLTLYLGGALRPLPLPELDTKSGARLLSALGVHGAESDREAICAKLRGHPLGLRIFARSMPSEFAGDPTRLWEQIFDEAHLKLEDTLEAKLRRLLYFYQERLPSSHRHALSLVALFRMPVGESILAPLWIKLFRDGQSAGSLRQTLDELHSEHLLTADVSHDNQPRYTCHPIIRDHFRTEVLRDQAVAREAAGLLADQPDAQGGLSLDGVVILAAAIEALLEAGETNAADELYSMRLDDGRTFVRLLAPHIGLEVTRYFVRDQPRTMAVRSAVGPARVGFYLNGAGVFARDAGEPESAYDLFGRAEALYLEINDTELLADARAKLADVQISLGNMRVVSPVAMHVSDAIGTRAKDPNVYRQAAYAALLQGDIDYADSLFEKARKVAPKTWDENSIGLFAPAEYYLRRGHAQAAYSILVTLRNRLADRRSVDQLSRCEAMLARAALAQKNLTIAAKHLTNAKSTFIAAHMIYDLAALLMTEARCSIENRRWEEAHAALERSLQLAAPRKYRLIQADALNVRGWMQLKMTHPNGAGARDDAEAALHLSELCDYAWGQRDACDLMASALAALADPEAGVFRERAEAWAKRLCGGRCVFG